MRIFSSFSGPACLMVALFFFSCDKKETLPELTVPTTYDGATFAAYASQERALLNNLTSLVTVVNTGKNGEEVNPRDLALAFSTNSPTIRSYTNSYFTSLLEGTQGYFSILSKASGKSYTPSASPTGPGGVYGGYLFDSTGVEPAALIENGLLGATLYQYGLNLYIQNPNINNPATADQLLGIYGANPAFPNSPHASAPDRAVAALTARLDKNDGNGLYTKIKQNFLRVQAAYKAGEGYNQQRDQAFSDILTLWEKSLAGTAIHTLQQVVDMMSKPAPSDAEKAEALHRYSQGIGLLLGFRTISNKTITDARLDELLSLLNFQPTGLRAAYKLTTEPTREVANVKTVISGLQTTYGFSDQEMENLRTDWVVAQGR